MWFCSEMANQGVPDRYLDAFCGRVPKSVLSRHYTDFSPTRLKQIYDKASLTVLSWLIPNPPFFSRPCRNEKVRYMIGKPFGICMHY
jgi:hypothetical protein